MLLTEATPNENKAEKVPDSLAEIRHMVQSCIQCGTCTGSCPNAFAMDHTPRQLWRMVLMGRKDEIFHSKTFSLCSSCYNCKLRCPRGLELTKAMHGLKMIAMRENIPQYKETTQFYKNFMNSVMRHGRVHETEVMTKYLFSMEPKHPLALLKFAPLGLKLLSRGKLAFHLTSKGDVPLDKMYNKVKELESGV